MHSDGSKLPPLIVLLGPTAVGKTELSLQLAKRFDGEIIGADSRQIYREMDIGTAKPTRAELQRVPHHLIDICRPDEVLTLAQYQRLAYATIDDIHARGHGAFLIGGTALYLRSVVLGLRIPEVPPDPIVRAELEAFLADNGRDALFARLQELDPRTAAVIDGRNPRRVLRALEIFLITGRAKIDLEGADPPSLRILLVGLDLPRAELYARTDARVDQMVAEGLLDETRCLLEAGYAPTLPAMTSLGYREMIAHLEGEMTMEEAVAKMKTETHRFVRHQYTSFRKMADVHWFDLADANVPSQVADLIDEFLN